MSNADLIARSQHRLDEVTETMRELIGDLCDALAVAQSDAHQQNDLNVMLGPIDKARVTITVNGIELLALKKLSHMLALNSDEQRCLAALDGLIRQIELSIP